MKMVSRTDWLRKELYNSIRRDMTCNADDSEMVKLERDSYISEHFDGRNYKELDDLELEEAIKSLENNTKPNPVKSITYTQEKTLKYLSIEIALRDADMSKLNVIIGGALANKSESAARALLLEKWAKKERLDSSATRYLFENHINPLLNKFLADGKFRNASNKKKLYFHTLNFNEASHLITRLTNMLDQKKKSDSTEANINFEYN